MSIKGLFCFKICLFLTQPPVSSHLLNYTKEREREKGRETSILGLQDNPNYSYYNCNYLIIIYINLDFGKLNILVQAFSFTGCGHFKCLFLKTYSFKVMNITSNYRLSLAAENRVFILYIYYTGCIV